MKPAQSKALIEDIKKRGYLFDTQNNCYVPPGSPRFKELAQIGVLVRGKKNKRLQGLKTGWIDDTRNIANKGKQVDTFIRLVLQVLGLTVWPEFFFLTDRLYRFDYCIPTDQDGKPVRIAIEVDGGIWSKGNSGHSSGTGIARDMDKSTLANVNGWTLIRRVPDQLNTQHTLDLIAAALVTLKR